MTRSGFLTVVALLATASCATGGCLSGAYEKDYEARLQQYRREAAGGPPAPAAAPAAQDQAPDAAGP